MFEEEEQFFFLKHACPVNISEVLTKVFKEIALGWNHNGLLGSNRDWKLNRSCHVCKANDLFVPMRQRCSVKHRE